MDGASVWAAGIISACGAAAICKMLIGKTNLSRTADLVFGLFVLCALTMPVVNIASSLGKLEICDKNDVSVCDDIIMLEKETAEKSLTELVKKTLKENNIECESCSVSIDSENDEITDISCCLALDEEYMEQKAMVCELLLSRLGIRAEIIV